MIGKACNKNLKPHSPMFSHSYMFRALIPARLGIPCFRIGLHNTGTCYNKRAMSFLMQALIYSWTHQENGNFSPSRISFLTKPARSCNLGLVLLVFWKQIWVKKHLVKFKKITSVETADAKWIWCCLKPRFAKDFCFLILFSWRWQPMARSYWSLGCL